MSEPAAGSGRLGAFDLGCVVVSGIIGVGIFFTPGKVAAAVDDSTQVVVAWAIGGVLAILGAFVFADLSRRVPGHGGTFVYIHEAFGRAPAFLYGWANWLVIQSGAIGIVALVLMNYLDGVLYGQPTTSMDVKVVASIALIAGLTAINTLGLHVGRRVQNTLTVIKTGAVFVLVALAFVGGGGDAAASVATREPRGVVFGIAAALLPVLFSFGGWQQGAFVAGAARRPRRDVPVGIIGGVSVVVLAYLSVNLAFLSLLGFEAASTSQTIAEDAARVGLEPLGLGELAGRVISVAVVLSALGILNTMLMAPPYVLHAMAEKGVFFQAVGRLHPTTGAPTLAVLVQGGWAMALLLGTYAVARDGAIDTLDFLLQGIVFVDWVFFAACGAAAWVLQRRSGDASGALPIVFSVGAIGVTAGAIWAAPVSSAAGLALCLLGLPLFAYVRKPAGSP